MGLPLRQILTSKDGPRAGRLDKNQHYYRFDASEVKTEALTPQ